MQSLRKQGCSIWEIEHGRLVSFSCSGGMHGVMYWQQLHIASPISEKSTQPMTFIEKSFFLYCTTFAYIQRARSQNILFNFSIDLVASYVHEIYMELCNLNLRKLYYDVIVVKRPIRLRVAVNPPKGLTQGRSFPI